MLRAFFCLLKDVLFLFSNIAQLDLETLFYDALQG